MKEKFTNRFLINLMIFSAVIIYWRTTGTTKAEYWGNFSEIEGELNGPFVISSVLDNLYINGKGWSKTKKELRLGGYSYLLDSLLSPFFKNQLREYTDTLSANNKIVWGKSKKLFESRALRLDTFIEVKNRKIPILIEQKPVFKVDYRISIKESNKYFTISTYKFNDINQWKYDEETPFDDFTKHKDKIDSILQGKERLKITVLHKRDSVKNGRALRDTGWRKPYIIRDLEGNELFYDKSAFEALKYQRAFGDPNWDFILWYEGWWVKLLMIILGTPVVFYFILMIREPASSENEGE